MTATSPYVYSNEHSRAKDHLSLLAEMLDAHSTARLATLRVPLRDARCLEIGAGGGSIARWLADQVGPGGHVVATDIAPVDIPAHPRLEVRTHDVVSEEVPAGPWDVIHTRLVLMHLPQRRDVLRKLAGSLRPGGVLLVEDMDMSWRDGRSMRAPTPEDAVRYERHHDMVIRIFEQAGVELAWASRVPQAMEDAGLVDVTSSIRGDGWPGGTAGALFIYGGSIQLDDKLRQAGATPQELDRVRELMHDPRMMIRMSPLMQTAGYRP
jgi:SAM-dependent methyltransferase